MRLWGFIKCLFDAHYLRYEMRPHWAVCVRCGEVRLTEDEYRWLLERDRRRRQR